MITLIKNFFKLIKDYQSIRNKPLTEYEQIVVNVGKINSNYFINSNNRNNSLVKIRSMHDRLPKYINKLKEVNGYLNKDKAIYNAWCSELEKEIRLNDFFLTDKDFYIDEVKSVEEFKILSLNFLSFYYERSLTVDVGEHNTRVLSIFKESLINTIEDLISIANK